ncbi:MAG: helix-turn-helix domain-containing protein, partial [Anaerolineae bacterium]|nr:helix-turn-helix domain-containing protein [Anaerolineae bacterium]
MADLAPICRALDLVEEQLTSEIGVANMACAAGYSLYHFCRTFNAATHHTPYDYLMRRRLAQAAREVMTTPRRILDIALDYQFNNPETFSRAFKRLLGLLPGDLRRQGTLDPRYLMPRLTPAHLAQIARGDYLRPVHGVERVLHVAGISTLLKDDSGAVADLWDLLHDQAGHDHGTCYGMIYYPSRWETRGALYMAAVEMDDVTPLRGALAHKTLSLPAHTRFVHKGARDTLHLSLDYLFHTWLPKAGQVRMPAFIVEEYGRSFPEPDDKEAEIGILVPDHKSFDMLSPMVVWRSIDQTGGNNE